MKRSRRAAAVSVAVLALALGAAAGDRLQARAEATRDALARFTELVGLAHDRYATEVSYDDLVYSSINGMLRVLDPHTSFLSAEAYASLRGRQQTSFYGIGVLVGIRAGQLTVVSPLEGMPAARMGMRAGDVISTIEGEPTEQMTFDEAVSKIKGPLGTTVTVTLVRRGMPEPIKMSLTRAKIPQTTVRQAYMLDATTGYIQLTEFTRGTGREVADALAKLRQAGMERLLLDFRNNGGGLMDQAIEVADQFLPAGSTIVQTRGRTRDSVQSFKASARYPPLDLAVVVLVNEGTASAAEIVSGALQDHDRALIVGTPTWGKGLVQTVYNLSEGNGIALTTARYHTPSGRQIQRDYSSYFDYYVHADAGPSSGSPAPGAPTFHTDLGREVYGGGGIHPDVVVEDRELSPFEQFLLARNAFGNFAVDYAGRNAAAKDGSADEGEILAELGRWLVAEKLATQAEVDAGMAQPEVRTATVLQVRAELLTAASGTEARHRTLAAGDVQLQRALGLFDRAAAMVAARQKLAVGR